MREDYYNLEQISRFNHEIFDGRKQWKEILLSSVKEFVKKLLFALGVIDVPLIINY